MPQEIFKAYDIRGKYPEQINEDLAYKLGRVFAEYLHHKVAGRAVMVGHGVRNSSHELSLSLIKGLTEGGMDVDFIHVIPTDVFYYAVATSSVAGGVMVTASHNPISDNGFKFVNDQAEVIGGTELQYLKKLIDRLPEMILPKSGEVKSRSVISEFVEFTLNSINLKNISKDLHFLADPGNGFAEIVLTELLPKIPCRFEVLDKELSGDFPGHGPNPLLNHENLSKEVVNSGSDFGVVWDGDGDRIFFLDEKGNIVLPDYLVALLVKYFSKKLPNLKVVCDIRTSKSVNQIPNVEVVRTRVGRDATEAEMKKIKAFLGGESSGHIYLRQSTNQKVWYVENTYFILLSVLEILSTEKKTLSELVKKVIKFAKSEELNFDIKDKKAILDILKKEYKNGSISEIDGVSVEFKDWWFNARASNTEDLIRINIEADSQSLLQEKISEISSLLKS